MCMLKGFLIMWNGASAFVWKAGKHSTLYASSCCNTMCIMPFGWSISGLIIVTMRMNFPLIVSKLMLKYWFIWNIEADRKQSIWEMREPLLRVERKKKSRNIHALYLLYYFIWKSLVCLSHFMNSPCLASCIFLSLSLCSLSFHFNANHQSIQMQLN